MKSIAFTGMPFSGKSEAVKTARETGISVIRMGDMVWNEVQKRDLEINDKNVGRIATEMRKKHGKDVWAKKTIEKIKSLDKDDYLVIDGVRNPEEIKTFKKKLGEDFVLIAINASDKIRYKRALDRNRQDDNKDLEKVKERDRREKSWGIDEAIQLADITVKNEKNIQDFRKKIKKILNNLK